MPKSWIQGFGMPKYWIQDFGMPKSWIQDFESLKSWIQDFGSPKSLIQDCATLTPRYNSMKITLTVATPLAFYYYLVSYYANCVQNSSDKTAKYEFTRYTDLTYTYHRWKYNNYIK